jgi:putative oxidoreductase
MEVSLWVLRIVVGACFIGHGCQTLVDWFGGHGLPATGGAFEGMGLTPAIAMVHWRHGPWVAERGWEYNAVVSALAIAAAARVTAPDTAGPARPAGA